MIDATHTVCPEWQNENTLRSYPVADDAPASDMIPAWLIADLRITADARYSRLFISNVYISDTLVSVGISGVVGDGAPVGLLTRAVTRDELVPFRAYTLDRLTDTAIGVIAFGEPPEDTKTVKLTMGPADSQILESAIVRSKTPGVTRIVDAEHGLYASGIVDLSGNSEFKTYLDPDDATTIIIELDDMYKELTTSVCSMSPAFDTCGETPVKTINGVAPARDGTITLKFR